jgi:hypothetical protein
MPVKKAKVGEEYRYQIVAKDVDSNVNLGYLLLDAPMGMKIDPL